MPKRYVTTEVYDGAGVDHQVRRPMMAGINREEERFSPCSLTPQGVRHLSCRHHFHYPDCMLKLVRQILSTQPALAEERHHE